MTTETCECPNGDCGVLLNRSDVSADGGCRYCLQNSDALARWVATQPEAKPVDGSVDKILADDANGFKLEWQEAELLAAELRRLTAERDQLKAELERRNVAHVEPAITAKDRDDWKARALAAQAAEAEAIARVATLGAERDAALKAQEAAELRVAELREQLAFVALAPAREALRRGEKL
jgi:hypothetical protein